MKKLNFPLIGYGRILENHVAAAAENAELMELVAVCDLIEEWAEEKAANLQEKTGKHPAVYTDRKKALEKFEVDCCSIATESGYHAEITLDCLRRGKHVLVEEPMASSTHGAQLMIQKANSHGLKSGVCHQNRFNAPIQELHRATEDNRFGKLVSGTARILWNRSMPYYEQTPQCGTWEQDDGTLMNQCIHNIDLLQWNLGGELEIIMATTGNYLRDIAVEDFDAILIRFKNDAIGMIEGIACVYPKNLEETPSIFGETGAAVIGGLVINRVGTWNFSQPVEQDERVAALAGTDPIDIYGHGHSSLYVDYIRAIQIGTQPFVSETEGTKALKIILAAYKSQKTGQAVRFDDLGFSTLDMDDNDVRYHSEETAQ